MCEAFDRVPKHTEAATHSVHFAFCVLEQPTLVEFDLDFSADWREHLGQRFRVGQGSPQQPEWTPIDAPLRATAPRTTASSYGKTQQKALVYVPSIEPRSFIHLSTRGTHTLSAHLAEHVPTPDGSKPIAKRPPICSLVTPSCTKWTWPVRGRTWIANSHTGRLVSTN